MHDSSGGGHLDPNGGGHLDPNFSLIRISLANKMQTAKCRQQKCRQKTPFKGVEMARYFKSIIFLVTSVLSSCRV